MIRALVLLFVAGAVCAQPIQRSRAEVRAFRAENPCPATGRVSGPCDGWQVDHIKPLCLLGADSRHQMQWIRTEDHSFKSHVDRLECRKLRKLANTPAIER